MDEMCFKPIHYYYSINNNNNIIFIIFINVDNYENAVKYIY